MKTILVVDDEERIRRILWEILNKKGFHVIKAKDAMEAHAILREGQKVDLILLDINLPAVQGDKLYDVLQAFHPNVKVIVCSVLPFEEQNNRLPGAADYYDKSESFAILLQKIEMIFNQDIQNKKVLVIDDDPRVRLLYKKVLMGAGYFPIEIGDSPDPVHFLKKQIHNIDLVLLDIAMPKVTGMEIFETIKRERPDAKVIITSVFSEDQQKFFIFKADDYFDKSTSHRILLEKIKCLVG